MIRLWIFGLLLSGPCYSQTLVEQRVTSLLAALPAGFRLTYERGDPVGDTGIELHGAKLLFPSAETVEAARALIDCTASGCTRLELDAFVSHHEAARGGAEIAKADTVRLTGLTIVPGEKTIEFGFIHDGFDRLDVSGLSVEVSTGGFGFASLTLGNYGPGRATDGSVTGFVFDDNSARSQFNHAAIKRMSLAKLPLVDLVALARAGGTFVLQGRSEVEFNDFSMEEHHAPFFAVSHARVAYDEDEPSGGQLSLTVTRSQWGMISAAQPGLRQLGYSTLDVDLSAELTHFRDRGTAKLRMAADGVAELSAQVALGGELPIRPELRFGTPDAFYGFGHPTLNGGVITYVDHSLIDHMLLAAAVRQNRGLEDVRPMVMAGVAFLPIGSGPQTESIREALVSLVKHPGALTVTVSPPAPLDAAAFASVRSPADAVRVFGLSAKAAAEAR